MDTLRPDLKMASVLKEKKRKIFSIFIEIVLYVTCTNFMRFGRSPLYSLFVFCTVRYFSRSALACLTELFSTNFMKH